MRLAMISNIHDNLTALEAVLMDLPATSPDLVLQGGDLVKAVLVQTTGDTGYSHSTTLAVDRRQYLLHLPELERSHRNDERAPAVHNSRHPIRQPHLHRHLP